jgi:hypothetical protein
MNVFPKHIRYFNIRMEGAEYMCKAMEDRINERVKIIVLKMLTDGNLSYEQIAAFTDLTVEQIERIAEELKAVSA